MLSQPIGPHRLAGFILGLVFCVGIGCPSTARADVPPDDRVVRLTVTLQSGQVVQGTITEYDTFGFTVTDADGAGHRLLWTSIPVDAFERYWRFMESPEGDGEALLELGVLLSRHRDGEGPSGRVLDEALEADPDLRERIEQARRGDTPGEGPRFVGVADPTLWGDLDETTMTQSVEQLRAFCLRAKGELDIPLELYESPRFLICTDLDAEHVQAFGNQLTRGYRAVAQLLDDDPDGNVFRGKCLIFVFNDRRDYYRFQQTMHDTDAVNTGGLCHGFGNGFVHIAVHRRLSMRETTHVVVHEFVHGYLHRYRSPEEVPSWINEGLAEYIAHTIEPPSGAGLYRRAAIRLEGEQLLGERFFEREHLQAWQYDVAGALTQYMLERSTTRYPVLIDQIKEGADWDAALEEAYRMDHRRMVQRFKRRLDRELLPQRGE